MNQMAGIFITIITIGVLGVTGTAVLQGTVDNTELSTIISEQYDNTYSGANVSGIQTIDIQMESLRL
jgi:hypothetical protein